MDSSQVDLALPISELRCRSAERLGIEPEALPRHIAIIMDGNGRWAINLGRSRVVGHRAGAQAVRRVITEARSLGIEVLTLYSFSLENWKRPTDEVSALMSLAVEHFVSERNELINNGIRFHQIGHRDRLPPDVLKEMDETIKATSGCDGLHLVLALNYGSRTEITDAARAIAHKVRDGSLDPETISEATIDQHLYTAHLPVPDPDLLIRTAGEFRLSNYLLWQCSYAEIVVTDTLWPDFDENQLHLAIHEYANRDRRYGALTDANS